MVSHVAHNVTHTPVDLQTFNGSDGPSRARASAEVSSLLTVSVQTLTGFSSEDPHIGRFGVSEAARTCAVTSFNEAAPSATGHPRFHVDTIDGRRRLC